jgi:hypothetical protein
VVIVGQGTVVIVEQGYCGGGRAGHGGDRTGILGDSKTGYCDE